jgi:hypothetical protein
MQTGNSQFETKTVLSAFFIIGIALVLPITIFISNQTQTVRQEASIGNYDLPSGCPETNPDRTTNTCRPTLSCPDGEYIKWDGNDECEQKLQVPSYCCSTSSRLAP